MKLTPPNRPKSTHPGRGKGGSGGLAACPHSDFERIARRARELREASGGSVGDDLEHWYAAELEIRMAAAAAASSDGPCRTAGR